MNEATTSRKYDSKFRHLLLFCVSQRNLRLLHGKDSFLKYLKI